MGKRGHTLVFSKLKELDDMLEVFNLEGMPVVKVKAEEKENFALNALDGKGLPCGIYFVRIQRGTELETAKLLVC